MFLKLVKFNYKNDNFPKNKMIRLMGNFIEIPLSLFTRSTLSDMLSDLTVKTKNYVGQMIETKLYKIEDKNIYIPRMYGVEKIKKLFPGVEYKYDIINGMDINIEKKNYELQKWQQKYGTEMFLRHFNGNDNNGCIMVLPTGVGKTYLLLAMFYKFKKKTLWFTVSNVVVKQTINIIKKSLPSVNVKKYGEDGWKDADCIISTVHSFVLPSSNFRKELESGEDAKKFRDSIGFVIYDEVHTLGGNCFGDIFNIVAPKYQLGASATPDRDADLMHMKYIYTIGPYFVDQKIEPPRFPGRIHVIKYYNNEDSQYREYKMLDSGRLNINKTLYTMTSDPKRYKILDYIIKDALKIGCVIIYCGFYGQMISVEKYLEDKFEDVYAISGKSNQASIVDALDNAKILLGTSKIFTGMSEGRFMSIILWSSIKKLVDQAIGRITRWNDVDPSMNNIVRRVYDIVDVGCLSSDQFEYRKNIYKDKEWNLQYYNNIEI
jgi:hypothetical protein